MKFKYWALGLLACGGLMACSNDDDIVGDEPHDKGDTAYNSSYMAVNLVMNNSGTRAATAGDDDKGTENESAIDVTKSVFLFYDANGNYLTQGKISTDNTTTTDPDDVDGNYLVLNDNKKSNAVIVLGPTAMKPTQVLAVLNDGSGDLVGKSLDGALSSIIESAISTDKGNFVMTNSSYVNSGVINATQIAESNIQETEEAAINHPVDIYVERVVAKLKVTETTTSKELSGDAFILDNATGATFKVVIEGWCANAVNASSYYVKNLDNAWIATPPFTTPSWTDANRTYWAKDMNYTGSNGAYPTDPTYSGLTYKSWSDATEKSGNTVYLYENTINNSEAKAAGGDNTNVTTVLVKAHIEYKKSGENDYSRGNIYKLANGAYCTKQGLEDLIVSNSGYYWSYTKDDNKEKVSLKSIDVKFEYSHPESSATPGDVAIDVTIIKPTVEGVQPDDITLVKDGSDDPVELSAAELALEKSSYAQGLICYNNGACYYQVPIEHLSSTDEKRFYGVVRNHSYVLTISNITGIGGAIYDEDEELPLIPGKDKQYYISSTLTVLPWKVVEQNVTLD